MKRKNIWAIAVTAASAILYSACNDSSTGADSNSDNGSSNNSPFYGTVGTFDELQVCTEKRNGMEILVKDEDKTYICQNEKWVVKGSEKLSSDSKADPADEGDSAKSSSSVKSSSSSSVKPTSSSQPGGAVSCGDLWCGLTDTEGRVLTGYESEYETSGYWYDFDDNVDPYNGDSKVSFPPDVDETAYGNFFGPLAEAYGGIEATISLGTAYEYPFVGFGFNIVSEEQQGADITDWGGVCLVYSSTAPFSVELGVEDEAMLADYRIYKATVAKSAALQVVDIPWTEFKTEKGWGPFMSQSEILKIVAAIRIKFTNSSGDFYLASIGRRGTCDGSVVASSSSTPKSSSSVKSSSSSAGYKEFPMSHDGNASAKQCTPATLSGVGKTVNSSFDWDGSDTEGRVYTGSEEETAGYWYVFNETTIEGVKGDSKVYFPSDVEEDAWGNFFAPLTEAYGGIKGRVELGTEYDYPVAGIGFSIVSEVYMEGADITRWGGICLVYSSTAPFTVELVAEDECSVTGFNNYKASVAKSANSTYIVFPWTKFKQETGWGTTVSQDEFLKHVAAIRIRFTSSADFFISAIGDQYGCMSGPGLPGFTY